MAEPPGSPVPKNQTETGRPQLRLRTANCKWSERFVQFFYWILAESFAAVVDSPPVAPFLSLSPLASWPAARHVLGIPSNRKDSERTQRWQQCGRYFFFSGSQLESSSIMIDKLVLWIFHKLCNSCAIERVATHHRVPNRAPFVYFN